MDCQLEGGNEGIADKNILDQDKLANLLTVLQTGEHGQALSNADVFILAPPDHHTVYFILNCCSCFEYYFTGNNDL